MLTRFRDITSQLVRTTAPTASPVTVAEAKHHCEYEYTDRDEMFARLIASATEQVEEEACLSLMPQTWTLRLDRFVDCIELRRPPVTAVSSVQYVDAAGDTQTLATSEYTVDLASFPARITPAWGKSWPVSRIEPNAITVVFTAGYASADLVPERAKHAIFMHVHRDFEERSMGEPRASIDAYERLVAGLKWDWS